MAASSETNNASTDGPVLSLINKRLRALRKKLNRISQMEESLSLGKTLNKEQEETLRSKPSVLAAIDELDKLRLPLLHALSQELQQQKTDLPLPPTETTTLPVVEEKKKNDDAEAVSDLLNLVYFGSVFDVKTLMSAHDNMLTRTHERNCCLTYDYVTDDDAAGDPLKEWDLDLISMMGGLVISRPVNSSLSHKNALEKCVEHAKLWLANSEQPIEPNSNVTYAGLKEKLNKIMASDYFTTTPEIKAPVEVAAAAGNYTNFQVPVHGAVIPPAGLSIPVEEAASDYQQEEEESPNSHENEVYDDEGSPVEEHHQGGSEVENTSQVQAQNETEKYDNEADEQNPRDMDLKEQHYANRRPYQNYRGGRGGGGGSRRGYTNGRGGRGPSRGGGYQNGRSQFYDQPGGYYGRNYNYRGRGGRGMGGSYNNYHASTGQVGHVQAAS